MKTAFTGAFNNELTTTEIDESIAIHGVLCSQNVQHYSDTEIKTLFWGRIFNKENLSLASIENDAKAMAILYKKHGTKAFAKIDGSFSAIIRNNKQTIILRDHHGTESQIYYNDTHYSTSLSELLKTPGATRNVNHQSISMFLSVGYIPTSRSAFNGISKLDAGSLLIIGNDGKKDIINVFDTSTITPSNRKVELEEVSEQYGTLHSAAIKRRIGNSNHVGILLSGGYDSGCNLAAIRKNYSGNVDSFSIGFKGDNWSELPLAQCMAERFGTQHHTYEIDGSEITALPQIVAELGDPFVEGGLMVNYAAMRMIGSDKPDIILGGDGSDQYFGTSGREVAMHYLSARSGARPLLNALYRTLCHERFDKNNKPYRVRFHLCKIINILQGDLFGFEHFKLKNLLVNQQWIHQMPKAKADIRSFEHLYTQHAYESDLEKIINQVILFKASRMASMFDNQIAFPYMDLELYHFLQSLPVNYKCKGESALKIARGEVTAKFLLKHHYKPQLPTEITSKKKQGGFAPMPIFFKDKTQRDRISEFVMQSSAVGELLNRSQVEKFIKLYDTEANQDGNWFWYKQNRAIQYFNLLNISIWWEQYVKNRGVINL